MVTTGAVRCAKLRPNLHHQQTNTHHFFAEQNDALPVAFLVGFRDTRPGNGAGLFLQPRSPHGATRAAYLNATSAVPAAVAHDQHRVVSDRHYVVVVDGDGQHRSVVIAVPRGDRGGARVGEVGEAVEAAGDQTLALHVSAQYCRPQPHNDITRFGGLV